MIYPIEWALSQVKTLLAKVTALENSTAVDFVRKSGDSGIGPLALLADPTEPLEVATKQYVDNKDTEEGFIAYFSTAQAPWIANHNKGRRPATVRCLVRIPSDPTSLYEYFGPVVEETVNKTVVNFGANYEGEMHLTFN